MPGKNGGNVRAKITPFEPCLFRAVFRYRLRLSLNIRRFLCLVRRAAIHYIIYKLSFIIVCFCLFQCSFLCSLMGVYGVIYRCDICHRNLTIAQALRIRAKEKASLFRLPLYNVIVLFYALNK